ncbi:phage tail sheath subtilisin-like domain-containing protein [Desulfoluna spongiiphila]|uniref:phage tail sheath subtilisin-like domain-containing protein n=1 Tax=Desulfoluna spongiiphila TaxID=419481 RepID=UPI0012519F56|nr:phage tail sheath subtilisin-like domain-containing protein [Desulfoluna spongiiphila]VVS90703.1 tail sheath protein subtilisin-like domain [Desulfoluna spongiiphila]
MSNTFLHGIETIEIDGGTRPIRTVKSAVIGLIGTAPDADDTLFPVNTPVLIPGTPRAAKPLGDNGTLKAALDAIFDQAGAMVVVVRVAEGADDAATLTNVLGDAAAGTGVHAFLAAESVVKASPRLLCAPGFTGTRTGDDANPVVAELQGLAEKMRAIVIADGPNTTATDAIAYRETLGSDRVFVVDPGVKVWDSTTKANAVQPASARVAGMIAKRDAEKGFWWSPSNQPVNGIVGTARPVAFHMSDPASEANRLNEKCVATIVQKNGYRLWGNRTTATDPMWAFLSVRRTADMIYESIEEAFLWAMDRPMSANLVLDIQESVGSYLRHLKAVGAILGGSCWLDPELNSKEQLMAGKLYLDFDIEPPAPLEHLTFRAHRDNGHYTELVNQVLSAS